MPEYAKRQTEYSVLDGYYSFYFSGRNRLVNQPKKSWKYERDKALKVQELELKWSDKVK